MKTLSTLLIAATISLFSVSAFAENVWVEREDLKLKYTTSCPDGEFDYIYIYKESTPNMDHAIKKYENAETCTLVAFVTDPIQQDHWHFNTRAFLDMVDEAHDMDVPVYLELNDAD